MKLTLDRAALLKALAHVQSVVERRNTIPILSNVKLEAEREALRLTATDMDLDISEAADADVAGTGVTTAPAHTLYEIVRKLPDGGQIEMDAADGGQQMVLRCGRSRFTLACLPVEDFPVMTAGELPFVFRLSARELRSLIDRTRFAISTEETRYYLNGIYIHATEAGGTPVLRAVATDGHRLARLQMIAPEGARDMPGVIAPRKTVGLIDTLAKEAKETLRIDVSSQKIRFAATMEFGNVTILSKLIDGTFPDYNRVIPTGGSIEARVDRNALMAATDRVATISSERGRAVKCEFADTGLTLSVTNPDAGESREELESEHEGASVTIGFNARYMLDMLNAMDCDTVLAGFNDAGSPATFRATTDGSALYVLMPMRV